MTVANYIKNLHAVSEKSYETEVGLFELETVPGHGTTDSCNRGLHLSGETPQSYRLRA
jgi:hypothetical protein